MKVSGFTIVRNATLLDYPFPENVLSILPLCDEFIINCGDSRDDTQKRAEELQAKFPEKVRLIHSVWQTEKQTGGFQLKHQTDLALKECKGDWCFYIQADEVVHEKDYARIRAAMERASQKQNVDGVLFDYLHFYSNYDYTVRGRNWYRREVRLFKNERGIEAFRDAQGFRKEGKPLSALPSGAEMFHYGYVRSVESVQKKSEEMSQWWGEKPEIKRENLEPKRHVGLQRFLETHPLVMKERIHSGRFIDPSKCRRVWDKNEIKNLFALLWESVVPYRIGEFRNYREV